MINAGAKIKDIQIGITDDNEIDTSTGNLVLDSANGTTIIDDNLNVTGNLVVDGTTNLNSTLDVANKATFEEVQIKSGVSTVSDSTTSNLTVTGVTSFQNDLSPFATTVRFKKGSRKNRIWCLSKILWWIQ